MSRPGTQVPVLVDVDVRGVVTITLNRPSVGNAYDGGLVTAMRLALKRVVDELPDMRLVVIRGAGRHFQVGAGLGGWPRSAGPARLRHSRVHAKRRG